MRLKFVKFLEYLRNEPETNAEKEKQLCVLKTRNYNAVVSNPKLNHNRFFIFLNIKTEKKATETALAECSK